MSALIEWGQHGHFCKLRYRKEALKSFENYFPANGILEF